MRDETIERRVLVAGIVIDDNSAYLDCLCKARGREHNITDDRKY